MLYLRRMVHPLEFAFESDGGILMYGDFYYVEDTPDENGKYYTIRATKYHNLRNQRRRDNWNYTIFNRAQSQKEYQSQLKEAAKELYESTVLDRSVWNKDAQNMDRQNNTWDPQAYATEIGQDFSEHSYGGY